jgi:hypothetical protein
MHRPTATVPVAAVPNRLARRLILATALLLGLAVALAPRTSAVHAQEPANAPATAPRPAAKSVTISDGRGAEIRVETGDNARAGAPAAAEPGATADAPPPGEGAGGDTTGRPGAKSRKHAKVVIDGLGSDREFDSFGDFAHNEPALATMVVAIVFVVFFAPVLAIALVLWYRMRKARMTNETMLKLAEKGIVPGADAMDALSGGKPAAAMAPYYEQARQIQRRAAWSDLRKGVLLGGVGLALSVYSLVEDREANGLGLVLLFVGIGFVVLWWFEQRHLVSSPPAAPDAGSSHGTGTLPGNPPPA